MKNDDVAIVKLIMLVRKAYDTGKNDYFKNNNSCFEESEIYNSLENIVFSLLEKEKNDTTIIQNK